MDVLDMYEETEASPDLHPNLAGRTVAYFPPLPLYYIGILIAAFFGSDFCRDVPSELPPRHRLDSEFSQVHRIRKRSWDR
jgi:hypothetical protein